MADTAAITETTPAPAPVPAPAAPPAAAPPPERTRLVGRPRAAAPPAAVPPTAAPPAAFAAPAPAPAPTDTTRSLDDDTPIKAGARALIETHAALASALDLVEARLGTQEHAGAGETLRAVGDVLLEAAGRIEADLTRHYPELRLDPGEGEDEVQEAQRFAAMQRLEDVRRAAAVVFWQKFAGRRCVVRSAELEELKVLQPALERLAEETKKNRLLKQRADPHKLY